MPLPTIAVSRGTMHLYSLLNEEDKQEALRFPQLNLRASPIMKQSVMLFLLGLNQGPSD